MNINDLTPGAARSNASQQRRVDTEKASRDNTLQQATRPGQPASSDRVELSEAARTAQAEAVAQQREIDFARRAMLSIPPLSQDRAEDILQRLQEGFYSQPEVLEQIAGRMIDAAQDEGAAE